MHEDFWTTKIDGEILCDICKKPIKNNASVSGCAIKFSFGGTGGAARHAFCWACARKHCKKLSLACEEVLAELWKVGKERMDNA